MNTPFQVPYPVNLLRNVALAAATTSHVLVIDVDMLPTPNLREDFQQHFTTLPRHDGGLRVCSHFLISATIKFYSAAKVN